METCGCDFEQSSLKLVYLKDCEQNSYLRFETFYVQVVVGSPVSLHVKVTVFIPI